MTELKTLKTMRPNVYNSDGLKFFREDELKAEAVKWVKDLEKEYKKNSGGPEIHQVFWIKHFFNITEEELIDD